MKISFSVSAFADLQDIIRYYNEQDASNIGIKFVKEIIDHVQVLSDHPDLGRIVPEFEQEHIREIIHKPYRIVYQRDVRSINIIRIWRSERLLILPEKA
jgi:toxin ParE1/3/4